MRSILLCVLVCAGCARQREAVDVKASLAKQFDAIEAIPQVGKFQMTVNQEGRVIRMNTMTGRADIYLIDPVTGGHWVELRDVQPARAAP